MRLEKGPGFILARSKQWTGPGSSLTRRAGVSESCGQDRQVAEQHERSGQRAAASGTAERRQRGQNRFVAGAEKTVPCIRSFELGRVLINAQIAAGLRAYLAVTSSLVLSNWYFCLRLSKKNAIEKWDFVGDATGDCGGPSQRG